ncbi:MAG: TRAP transporter substrate-binding protein DctP [bacterium]|nr:TRAP transporter substrate-binding protein DctP [bacterium]
MEKKVFFFCLTLVLFFLTCFSFAPPSRSAEPASKPQYVIKWGTLAPENTVWGANALAISKEITEKSGGRIKNIWYFGGVMGDEPDMVRKARINQIQGFSLLTIGISKVTPELTAFSLPFLFRNYDDIDCVFDRIWPLVEKTAEQKGYVVLGRADVGFSIFFSKKNLADIAEIKKAKVWKWSGIDLPLEELSSFMFGMDNFVTLALPDVLTALQTGMVDTVYGTYYTALALQWQTQFKYMTDVDVTGGAYAPSLMFIKKDVFESLPPDLQKIVRETCDKHFAIMRRDLRQDEANAKASLSKRGIKFMELNPVLYNLGRKCMETSIYEYYRLPEANLDLLRKNVDQCLNNLYAAAGKELNLPQPSPERTEKLVRTFLDMEGKLFSRNFVGQILQARDQCVKGKDASPKSK